MDFSLLYVILSKYRKNNVFLIKNMFIGNYQQVSMFKFSLLAACLQCRKCLRWENSFFSLPDENTELQSKHDWR